MPLAPSGPDLAGNYFIAVYPPFSAWEPTQFDLVESTLQQPSRSDPLGLYVHVPFCEKKCDYCYYLSFAGKPQNAVHNYLETMIEELRLYAAQPGIRDRQVSFAYFGGGTPSLLTPDQIRLIGFGLQEVIPWDNAREVTFECAPRTVRRRTVEALREIGVTRVSLGVQSFSDELLEVNGRIHFLDDILRAYELLQNSDFDCINIDLMAGLPGETWGQWKDSVRSILDLAPDSVTIYQTEMPYNTKAYFDHRSHRLPVALVPWPVKRERVDYAFNELERAGYTVVSGYTAVKEPDRHPFVYQDEVWSGKDLLGLGVASFSYLAGAHFQNVATLYEHRALVHSGILPVERARLLSEEERCTREFILQLKQGQVDRSRFLEKFDLDILELFAEPLSDLAADGWLEASSAGVRLTRPGLLRVDEFLPRFYLKEHQGVRYT